jgi:hypothetical protein
MEMDDYDYKSDENDTVIDENEEEKNPVDKPLDPNICELTVQFDCVLNMSKEELQCIKPPAFYEYFLEIAKGDMDRPEQFDLPSEDVTWTPRVVELLDNLATAFKYVEVKKLVDEFMVGHFAS